MQKEKCESNKSTVKISTDESRQSLENKPSNTGRKSFEQEDKGDIEHRVLSEKNWYKGEDDPSGMSGIFFFQGGSDFGEEPGWPGSQFFFLGNASRPAVVDNVSEDATKHVLSDRYGTFELGIGVQERVSGAKHFFDRRAKSLITL